VDVDVVAGFLGSGKTTFIMEIIAAVAPAEKLAVIVNEFGDVGIDGAVLSQSDTEVVELSSGCICCTLSRDLVKQVEMLARQYNPSRLLLEPSGVATVSSLLRSLQSLKLEQYIGKVRIISILDAVSFKALYNENRLYLEQQIRAASLIIINKIDLVEEKTIAEIVSTAAYLNSQAGIVATSFGRISRDDYFNQRERALDFFEEEELSSYDSGADHRRADHQHTDDQHAGLTPLPFAHDLEKWSFECGFPLDDRRLTVFLNALQSGEMGEVVRAKGIVFLTERGWVNFNLASGYISIAPIKKAPAAGKIFVAGKNLKGEALLASFKGGRS